jgi:hypothetical protein
MAPVWGDAEQGACDLSTKFVPGPDAESTPLRITEKLFEENYDH